MLRQAWSEVRRHPGRFVSTIVAIAISVAFLAGSAVLVATEGQAQGKAMNVALANADIVVTVDNQHPATGVDKVIAATPGVAAHAPVLSETDVVTSGTTSEALNLVQLPPEQLRWAVLTQGRWPEAADEVALSGGAAKALKVAVGDTLSLEGRDSSVSVVGVTDEPSGLFVKTGWAAPARFAAHGYTEDSVTQWVVKAAAETDVATVIRSLDAETAAVSRHITVAPAERVREEEIAKLATGFDAFANVLWAFAAVSLVVGMITIANTFSITLAQRRRQIGLLRAVGASGSQVRWRFVLEAALLGVIGSLCGVALGIGIAIAETAWSTALFWGLSVPVPQLALAFGLGVLTTVVAAFVPVLRGTRVAPLEALQPVVGGDVARRASIVRSVVCGLLLLGGAGLAVLAVTRTESNALLIAIGAGALIALGVLLGGPLFVPGLIRVSGRLFRFAGPVPRLAADNAERNPRRATSTATALMLAVGLMVTLQVATASVRLTVLDQLSAHYPIDLQVGWTTQGGEPASIPSEVAGQLSRVAGVDDTVLLPAGEAQVGNTGLLVLGADPRVEAVTGLAASVADDEVLVSEYLLPDLPATVKVKGTAGTLVLQVRGSRLVDYSKAMVSAANLPKIVKPVPDAVMWLSVPDRSAAVDTLAQVNRVVPADWVSGSVVQAATYEEVLNLLLMITTALLAVAVLIALVGVSNTLGLSVMERTRESALLRALGLQARSLRVMLLIEAVQVAVVGVAVGVVAGVFFGWLAVTALGRSGGFETVRFAVDVPSTAAMVAVAVAAAALASVLPGRRAAKAAPTQALAEV